MVSSAQRSKESVKRILAYRRTVLEKAVEAGFSGALLNFVAERPLSFKDHHRFS